MSLDLSKATKLKDVEFVCKGQNAEWVSAALRTAEVENLRSISLVLSRQSTRRTSVSALFHLGWVALDRLLVQLWTSLSLRTRVMYDWTGAGRDLERDVARFLPESTRGGILDIVDDCPSRSH
jgi:hypothetical protein